MTSVSFVVAGSPLSWARARRRGGRYFTDPAVKAYQHKIAWAFKVVVPGHWPLDRRYAVRIVAEHRDKRRRDVDRLAGCPLDALTGIAWNDDSQVDVLHVTKQVGDDPRLEVVIEVIGG